MYRPRLSDFHIWIPFDHITIPATTEYGIRFTPRSEHSPSCTIDHLGNSHDIISCWIHFAFLVTASCRAADHPIMRLSDRIQLSSIHGRSLVGYAGWYELHLSILVYWPLSTESMGLYSKWTRRTYIQSNRLSRRPSNQYRRYRRVESKQGRRLILATASLWAFYHILVSSRE